MKNVRLNILVACERSARVRDALITQGHNAISCDIAPAPGPHICGDVRHILQGNWDMMIAFPPCTHLSVSGARHFARKRADGSQQQAIDFFMLLVHAPIPKIAIENPVGIMSTTYRKPDQIIQPWQFGDPESKATCLWLKNLPKLTPTNILPKPETGRWHNQTPSGQNRLGPSPDRAIRRSTTYPGIANAMATQWTNQIQREP